MSVQLARGLFCRKWASTEQKLFMLILEKIKERDFKEDSDNAKKIESSNEQEMEMNSSEEIN